MDLKFRFHSFSPPKRFFGSLPETRQWIATRIKVTLKFKKEEKWDQNSYRFILDTGAYVSIAPDYLLERLAIKPVFDGHIHGIIDKEECEIQVKVAYLDFKFIDDNGNESSEQKGWFAFHPMQNGPLLLGMNGIFQNLGISKKSGSNDFILKA